MYAVSRSAPQLRDGVLSRRLTCRRGNFSWDRKVVRHGARPRAPPSIVELSSAFPSSRAGGLAPRVPRVRRELLTLNRAEILGSASICQILSELAVKITDGRDVDPGPFFSQRLVVCSRSHQGCSRTPASKLGHASFWFWALASPCAASPLFLIARIT